jgi:hypothetical protein
VNSPQQLELTTAQTRAYRSDDREALSKNFELRIPHTRIEAASVNENEHLPGAGRLKIKAGSIRVGDSGLIHVKTQSRKD